MTTKQIIITIVLLIACFPAAIGYVIYIIAKNKNKKAYNNSLNQIRQEAEANRQAFDNMRQSHIAQYGVPDKEIETSVTEAIFAHEATKQIYIQGTMYSFGDILSYEVDEVKFSEDGTTTTKTKVNNKSLLGRAAVGAVIAGPLGAVVGGATASTTSTTKQSGGYSDSYYDIVVKVHSISNPIIKIEAYLKEDAQEIVGLLEAVMANK